MRRVDFSTVINIIIESCRENMYTAQKRERAFTQTDLVSGIFAEYYDSCDDKIFESSSISRWIKGNRPVPADLINFYRENGSDSIGFDFQDNCADVVFDIHNLCNELVTLVTNDYTLSEEKKSEIIIDIDTTDESEVCSFIGKVIFTAIDRPFIPSDTPTLPTSAVTVADYVFGAEVPPPCRYFCGRDNELSKLHTAVNEHSKVFVSGFAGIGKSEFVKAYVKKFKSHYNNILYFSYGGNLNEMIADMDFIGDKAVDDEHIRYINHIRFLKNLRNDSLIIIDNFDVNGAGDSYLGTLMKLSCNIIFTTRSNIDTGHIFKLDIIENADELYNFVGKYYSHSEEDKVNIYALIETVHHHTLSVEMIAKLLDRGLHHADEILTHLQMSCVNPDSSDKIKIVKDGENLRATYYNHIRLLFSLYLLDEEYQTIMRSMVFADNIRIRYLAKLLKLEDTNGINELCDLGFIENNQADIISLHPMIRDVAVLDLKPSLDNCGAFFTSINRKILVIGNELPDSESVISVIGNVVKYADKGNKTDYLTFLENFFTFLDNYKEIDLMEIIISETENILNDTNTATANHRALLYNNKAMLLRNRNEKIPHAISLINKALALCNQNENPELFANLNMNLGLLYIDNNEVGRGLEFMDKSYLFIKLCREYNDDFITIARNYAAVLADNKMNDKALAVLHECEFAAEGCVSINHARLIYDIGALYILSKKYTAAVKKFNCAFSELAELGCFAEIAVRKNAAAEIIQKCSYEYPKEWETDYLE